MSEILPVGFMALVGKSNTRKTKFMGNDVEIRKLSISDVDQLRSKSEALNDESLTDERKEEIGRDIMLTTLRVGVVGATELTEENLATFPLDDINALTKEIMVYSGLMEKEGKLR